MLNQDDQWKKFLEDYWRNMPVPKYHFLHFYRLNAGIAKIKAFMKPYLNYPFEGFSLWHIGNEIYVNGLSEYTGIHHLTMEQLLVVITSIDNLTAKPELCRPCKTLLILPV